MNKDILFIVLILISTIVLILEWVRYSILKEKNVEALKQLKNLQYNISEMADREQYCNTLIRKKEEQMEKISSALAEMTEECSEYGKKVSESKKQYETEQEKLTNFRQSLNDSYERESEDFSNRIEQLRDEYKKEYLESIQSMSTDLADKIQKKQEELEKFDGLIKDYREKVAVAVEEQKRRQLIAEEQDFYTLILSEQDLEEIKELRKASLKMRSAEPINKVIYKVYYEKPYTDLIGRIFGNKPAVTGIYKITNTVNQKCYVGQAVNVQERWRQHIKRGVGAEAATRNKLYPAMLKYGPEKFTFELLESCSRDKLDEREDYWQEFYHAKDFGYSIK